MGIVKISEDLHDEIRKASGAMHRSINSQAEFWIKVGMMAELQPHLTYNQLVAELMSSASVSAEHIGNGVGANND